LIANKKFQLSPTMISSLIGNKYTEVRIAFIVAMDLTANNAVLTK